MTTVKPDAQYPLHGLKVLDFSRVLAGPFAGRMLSDLVQMLSRLSRPMAMSLACGVAWWLTYPVIITSRMRVSAISAWICVLPARLIL